MGTPSNARQFRISGLLAVMMLSVLSLEAVYLLSGAMSTLEAGSVDLRMRAKSVLQSNRPHPKELILIAIDPLTQEIKGRYGAGQWLSRKPFADQVTFVRDYFEPSVLAYDIIFQSTLEGNAKDEDRISESSEKIASIISDLKVVASDQVDLERRSLDRMNRLVAEQGIMSLASDFAAVSEDNKFQLLLGFNFRGGAIGEGQSVRIEKWSDADIFGTDESGNEEWGERIPYLNDMAIPSADVHFASDADKSAYRYCPNANMPSMDLLDYSRIAPLNGPRDDDGVVRRIPIVIGYSYYNSIKRARREVFVPSFSLAACLLHMGVDFPLEEGVVEVHMGREVLIHLPDSSVKRIPIDDDGQMYLNYDTRFDEFDAISFSNMSPSREKDSESHIRRLVGKYRRHVRGRIGIVGHTSTGIDVGSTPLYANINMVYVQMTAINNILSGKHVILMTGWRLWALWAVIAFLFTVVCNFEKTARLGPTAALVIAFYATLAYLGVHYDLGILPVVGPLFYFGMCSFSVLSFRFFTEEREKRKIRGMFSTMVSDKVLSYLEESPESFSLTGHNVEATVFFSDVASFTSISEHMEPERLTEFLNRYLTPVTDSIIESGGYVDKYVGDAVMAVWGAPYRDPEHAVNACRSALEQQEIIREMNEELKHEYGCEIHVRMGINSGTVTAGNMGSERKFQYTVMGDVVNLASRLEPANKDFGTRIILGEATNRLAVESIESRMLDKIVVIGKEEIVPVYELLGLKGQVDESILSAARAYEQALSQFYERNWDRCLELLSDVTSIDTVAAHLESRAVFCKKNPPPETWQGEYIRTEKK